MTSEGNEARPLASWRIGPLNQVFCAVVASIGVAVSVIDTPLAYAVAWTFVLMVPYLLLIWRPELELFVDRLVVTNPITKREIALADIVDLESTPFGLRIRTPSASYRAWALNEGQFQPKWARRSPEVIKQVSDAAGRDLQAAKET